MTAPTQVVLTRPVADACALAQKMAHDGITVLSVPMMEIAFAPIPPVRWQAMVDAAKQERLGLLFTSGNGVRAFVDSLSTLPATEQMLILQQTCCCVGAHTLSLAEAEGFAHCRVAGGNVATMLELIRHDWALSQRHWWHPRARDHRGDLVTGLLRRGIVADAFCAYSARELGTIPPLAQQALATEATSAVMLYSPRTARLWEAATIRHHLPTAQMWAYCLSPAVAEALQLPWKTLKIAQQTTSQSIEKLVYDDVSVSRHL